MDRELPICFDDTVWTVAQPALRTEIARRVRSRLRQRTHDRSDVVQEALNAAVRNRMLLRRLSPPQRSSWFWVVVSRLATRMVRPRTKSVLAIAHGDNPGATDIPDWRCEGPAAAIERSERVVLVREALATLPESWRQILTLRNRHPEDWAAVAQELGMTQSAARNLWYRALEGL